MQRIRNTAMALASVVSASCAFAQSSDETTPLNVSMFKVAVGIIIVVGVIRLVMRSMNR